MRVTKRTTLLFYAHGRTNSNLLPCITALISRSMTPTSFHGASHYLTPEQDPTDHLRRNMEAGTTRLDFIVPGGEQAAGNAYQYQLRGVYLSLSAHSRVALNADQLHKYHRSSRSSCRLAPQVPLTELRRERTLAPSSGGAR